MVELTEDQRIALDRIEDWYFNGETQTLTMGGYAGTGKTTLILYLIEKLTDAVRVCAPTGKAAYVLRRKGVPASTVHKLIYTPEDLCRLCMLPARAPKPDQRDEPVCHCPGPRRTKVEFVNVPLLGCKLVIVDEASMVNVRMCQDLESFGVPILYVGDHGQLEPVGDNPNLMRDPEIRLERIHRQAEDSSIIRFAHHVRVGGPPHRFTSDDSVKIMTDGRHPANLHEYDMVICSLNRTRVEVNARIRALHRREGLPIVGDRVLCLRNSSEHKVFNGLLATITAINHDKAELSVVDDDDTVYDRMPYYPAQFGAEETQSEVTRDVTLWDFGYCLTCHKVQGSEFERVVVLERIPSRWSATRWRYTAATRAAEELVYCVPR